MKIFGIGKGAREHATALKLSQDGPGIQQIWLPGNPGIAAVPGCSCITLPVANIHAMADLARQLKPDLSVVWNEDLLAAGICDRFREHGLKIFGPSQAAAFIEADKKKALDFMVRHHIPTGWHRTFPDFDSLMHFLATQRFPAVLKNPYLAKGKGAFICKSLTGAIEPALAIAKQQAAAKIDPSYLVMEYLWGKEVTLTLAVNGTDWVYLPEAQDHKTISEDKQSPMTGGMGAYAPVPFMIPAIKQAAHEAIVLPTIKGLAEEGNEYNGMLYVGLMLTEQGPKVVEFNERLGDPEAQVQLPIMGGNFLELLLAGCEGRLSGMELSPPRQHAVCVVLASGGYGYREDFPVDKLITGTDLPGFNHKENILVFHAGTRLADGELFSTSGRVITPTGLGSTLCAARNFAYAGAELIDFEDKVYRPDIARQALHF